MNTLQKIADTLHKTANKIEQQQEKPEIELIPQTKMLPSPEMMQ